MKDCVQSMCGGSSRKNDEAAAAAESGRPGCSWELIEFAGLLVPDSVVAGEVVEHADACSPPVRAELHHSSAMMIDGSSNAFGVVS
jgi:hypothetical protein